MLEYIDAYTKARLAECQTRTEELNVLAFMRLENKKMHTYIKGENNEVQSSEQQVAETTEENNAEGVFFRSTVRAYLPWCKGLFCEGGL